MAGRDAPAVHLRGPETSDPGQPGVRGDTVGLDGLVERALDFARLAPHHAMVPRTEMVDRRRARPGAARAPHHVMVPRTEMVAVPTMVSRDRLAELMRRHGHSCYPVCDSIPDYIVGVLSAKQLAAVLAAQGGPRPLPSTYEWR